MFAHCEHVCARVRVCVRAVCVLEMFSLLVLYFLFFLLLFLLLPLTRTLTHVHILCPLYILARSVCAPRVNDRLRQCRFLWCPPPPPSRMQIHSGEVCLNIVQRVARLASAAHVYVYYIIYCTQ